MKKKLKKSVWENFFAISTEDLTYTISILLIATVIASILSGLFIEKFNVSLVYFLAVVTISTITRGYVCGIFASVFGVFGVNFFFTAPFWAFNFTRTGYPVTFAVMLLASMVTSTLTVRAREQARIATMRLIRTEALYGLTKSMLGTANKDDIVELTMEYINNIFHCSVIFYLSAPCKEEFQILVDEENKEEIFLGKEDLDAASWCYENKKEAGAKTRCYDRANCFYVPIATQEKIFGVIGIHDENQFLSDNESSNFLRLLISQTAMALLRQELTDEQNKITIEAEKEKMRSNLLRAISHDLRTPLTGILGSSSALLESGEILDYETKQKLISDIKEDSQWLIRMVENLLSVTKINVEDTTLKKTPEAVEEIVGEAVSHVKKDFPGHKIKVHVPQELLLVPMDGTLIEQVLINIMINSIKHAGIAPEILVEVFKEEENVVFEISDNGKGIDKEQLPHLFEGIDAIPKKMGDSSRGMGIGLSICKTIVLAHGGTIHAENRLEGGALFHFELPLKGVNENGE